MADWVIDSLVGFLKSPFWSYPLSSFIDHHCTVFDPGDENKFSYTDIHKEYQTMVENLLESFMSDLGITSDQFSDVCSQESAFGQEHEHLFEQILAADNFLIFKSMMVQKNIELELRALSLLQRQLGHSPKAYSGDPEEEFLQGKGASSEDDAVLEEALKQSQKEYNLRQSLDEKEMDRLLEMAKAESLRLYQAQQREQEELAGHLEKVLQTSAPVSMSDSGTSKELESIGLQNETAPSSSELLTKPEQGPEELSTSTPYAPDVHAAVIVPVRNEPVAGSPENLTHQIQQRKPEDRHPQEPSSATGDVLPKGSCLPGTSRSKLPDHERRKEEPLKSCSPAPAPPGMPSAVGSGGQIKELSGAEAAARWIETAKADVQRGVTGGSILHGAQVSPDDLKARETYLRQQRDRLLEMKKKERAKQFDSFAASQSSSQSTLAKVARSAAEGDLEEGGGGEGRASAGSDRRGKNTGILCSTIAGKLKELAQENHT